MRRSMAFFSCSMAAVIAAAALGAPAVAQTQTATVADRAPPAAAVVALPPGEAEAPVVVDPSPPAAPAEPAPRIVVAEPERVPAVRADHLSVVGDFGLGFVGARDLAVGRLDASVPAPTLGVRYWISPRWAVELGLGLGHSSGTVAVQQPGATTTERDAASTWGVAVQVGVPIALAWGEHYTFLVVPETRLGFAWIEPGGDPDREESEDGADGTTFEWGARAGAEIHFGFLGVPELALEATVGLFVRSVSVSETSGASGNEATALTVGTISYGDPWDFFRTSIAARYYF